jgi:hypothetical protein
MSPRSNRIRDESLLALPYIAAVIIAVIIMPYPPRNSIFVWLIIGGAMGLASLSTWFLPPFKAIQLRKLKAMREKIKRKT